MYEKKYIAPKKVCIFFDCKRDHSQLTRTEVNKEHADTWNTKHNCVPFTQTINHPPKKRFYEFHFFQRFRFLYKP